jgi:hypothetical protein
MVEVSKDGEFAWTLLCDRLGRDPATSEESDTCSLRAAWKAMLAYAATLQAERDRYRVALEALAKRASAWDGIPPPKYFGDTDCVMRYYGDKKIEVPLSELRDARTALSDTPTVQS